MRKPSKKAKMISARLTAVQAVYQMAMSDMTERDAYEDYVTRRMGKEVEGDNYVPADTELFSKILNGVAGERDAIRDMVLGALNGQKPEPLLQAIMFCGVFELKNHLDFDAPVIINDYVNVTHGFFDQPEANLVNAVLDRQSKNLRV
jgi:N utilization substance protein B